MQGDETNRRGRRLTWFIFATSVLLVLMVGFAYGITRKTVYIADGERLITVKTFAGTVGEVLGQAGIKLKEEDRVIPAINTEVSKGMEVTVVRAYPVKVIADGREKQVITTPASVAQVLNKAGISLRGKDKVLPALTETLARNDVVRVVRVTTEEVTTVKEVPFGIVRKEAETLERGLRRVVQRGEPGREKIVTRITYEDGVEVAREVIDKQLVKEPRNQVVAMGTVQHYSRGSRNFRFERAIEVVATGYTHTGNDTFTGVYPEVGTVAVDPNVIPLGTKLYVEGYGFAKAQDIGSAIKGKRIDLFFDTREDALSWGRRSTKVYILE